MPTKLKGISVALGTAGFGSSISPDDAFKIMDVYAGLGGRVLDTANNYAYWRNPERQGGQSETVVGQWLQARGCRAQFTLMTKIGSQPVNGVREGLAAAAVRAAVNQSLARLQTDYIDILLAHHDDPETPLLETWQAFSELVAGGQVKMAGISNYNTPRIGELVALAAEHSLAPVEAVQMRYSLVTPNPGADFGPLEVLDAAMRKTLARLLPRAVIFGYSPLLQGLYEKNTGDAWPGSYDTPENRRMVSALQAAAREQGVSPSAYVLKKIAEQGIWPVTATSKPERLASNLQLFTEVL